MYQGQTYDIEAAGWHCECIPRGWRMQHPGGGARRRSRAEGQGGRARRTGKAEEQGRGAGRSGKTEGKAEGRGGRVIRSSSRQSCSMWAGGLGGGEGSGGRQQAEARWSSGACWKVHVASTVALTSGQAITRRCRCTRSNLTGRRHQHKDEWMPTHTLYNCTWLQDRSTEQRQTWVVPGTVRLVGGRSCTFMQPLLTVALSIAK